MLSIIGERQTGKTKCLIEISNGTGYPIMAATRNMAKSIELMALRMHKDIPPVITPSGHVMKGERVIVDEAGLLIESITGAKVVAASIDGVALVKAQQQGAELAKLGIWEAFKLWRSERKRARSGGEVM